MWGYLVLCAALSVAQGDDSASRGGAADALATFAWPPVEVQAPEKREGMPPVQEDALFSPRNLKVSGDGSHVAFLEYSGHSTRLGIWPLEPGLRVGRRVFDTKDEVLVGIGPYDNAFGWCGTRLVYSGIEGMSTVEQAENAGEEALQHAAHTWVCRLPEVSVSALTSALCAHVLGQPNGPLVALLSPMRPGKGVGDIEVWNVDAGALVAEFSTTGRAASAPPSVRFPLFWSPDGSGFFAYAPPTKIELSALSGDLVSVDLRGSVTRLTGVGGARTRRLTGILDPRDSLRRPAPVDGNAQCVAALSAAGPSTALYISRFSLTRQLEETRLEQSKLPAGSVVAFSHDGHGLVMQTTPPPRVWHVEIDTYHATVLAENALVEAVYGPLGGNRLLVAVSQHRGDRIRRELGVLSMPRRP